MPNRLFPEILCLTIAVKYHRMLVQVVTSEPRKYPAACLLILRWPPDTRSLDRIKFKLLVNLRGGGALAYEVLKFRRRFSG